MGAAVLASKVLPGSGAMLWTEVKAKEIRDVRLGDV